MQKTIIIAEVSEKNGWFNVKTNEGTEVSVMSSKCPKLTIALKEAKAGSEVTGNLVEKDGKNYMWDSDEKKGFSGGSKPFTPADKGFTAANSAAVAASQIMALQKDATYEKWLEMAEKMQAWILSKKAS